MQNQKKACMPSLPNTKLYKLNSNPPQNRNVRAANPLFAHIASAAQPVV